MTIYSSDFTIIHDSLIATANKLNYHWKEELLHSHKVDDYDYNPLNLYSNKQQYINEEIKLHLKNSGCFEHEALLYSSYKNIINDIWGHQEYATKPYPLKPDIYIPLQPCFSRDTIAEIKFFKEWRTEDSRSVANYPYLYSGDEAALISDNHLGAAVWKEEASSNRIIITGSKEGAIWQDIVRLIHYSVKHNKNGFFAGIFLACTSWEDTRISTKTIDESALNCRVVRLMDILNNHFDTNNISINGNYYNSNPLPRQVLTEKERKLNAWEVPCKGFKIIHPPACLNFNGTVKKIDRKIKSEDNHFQISTNPFQSICFKDSSVYVVLFKIEPIC